MAPWCKVKKQCNSASTWSENYNNYAELTNIFFERNTNTYAVHNFGTVATTLIGDRAFQLTGSACWEDLSKALVLVCLTNISLLAKDLVFTPRRSSKGSNRIQKYSGGKLVNTLKGQNELVKQST